MYQECGSQTFSQTVTLFTADEYAITIGFEDPAIEGCEIEERTLIVEEIRAKGIGRGGVAVDVVLGEGAYEDIPLSWELDGVPIEGANQPMYIVTNLEQVGKYTLRVDTDVSNELDVNLRVSISELTPSSEFLCFDSSLTISAFGDSFTYNWFFNGVPIEGENGSEIRISEPGTYQAEVTSAECGSNLTDELIIELFGEDVIQVDPGFSVGFGTQESITLTASGGISYEWYAITKDENGNITSEELLSVEENLEVFETVFEEAQVALYQLRSQVGSCVVANDVTVRRELSDLIPSVITANGDNINDRWVIPSAYVDKEEVNVTIFNIRGEIDFSTNRYQNNWPEMSSKSEGQDTVYYYIINNRESGETEKGSITVMR